MPHAMQSGRPDAANGGSRSSTNNGGRCYDDHCVACRRNGLRLVLG